MTYQQIAERQHLALKMALDFMYAVTQAPEQNLSAIKIETKEMLDKINKVLHHEDPHIPTTQGRIHTN